MILEKLFGDETKLSTKRPEDWERDALVLYDETAAGEHVNPYSALSLAAYKACLNVISEDCGKLPLITYRRVGPRNKKRAKDHPVYSTLHDMANPEMTSMALRENVTQHAAGWGNGYALIRWAQGGRGIGKPQLWPVTPDRVEVKRNNQEKLYYEVISDAGRVHDVQSADMLHIHGMGWDGTQGYSLATLARETIGMGIGAEKHGAALFGNSSRPGGVLEHPGEVGPDGRKNIIDDWQKIHRGSGQAHLTAILEEGMTFKPTAIPGKDSQWIESRQHNVEDICRWCRVAPHKIQHLLRATYSNIEWQSLEHWTDTMLSWLIRWEQEIWIKLLLMDQDLFAEHLIEGMLRGDLGSRYAAYAIARQWGWFSANDVLELENRNGIGAQGDIYFAPMNMMPADMFLEWAEKQNTPEPEPETPEPVEPEESDEEETEEQQAAVKILLADAVRKVARDGSKTPEELIKGIADVHKSALTAAYGKILSIESEKLGRAVKRHDFTSWCEEFYVDHLIYVRGALAPVIDTFCGSVWTVLNAGEMSETATELISRQIDAMARNHVDLSQMTIAQSGPGTDAKSLGLWRNGRAAHSSERELNLLSKVVLGLCNGTAMN